MKRLFNYFIQGLVVVVPFFVTVYVIYAIFNSIDKLLPFNIPGLGFIIVISFITLIGFVTKNFFAKSIFVIMDNIIEKIPGISLIYTSTKDIVGNFIGNKRKFNKPVLVTVNKELGMKKLGFITKEDLSVLGISNDNIAVYLPHSYGFTGNLFVVPVKYVEPLNITSAELMKFILSGGMINIENIEPEKDETNNKQKK